MHSSWKYLHSIVNNQMFNSDPPKQKDNRIKYYTKSYPFQNRYLPRQVICKQFEIYSNTLWKGWHKIATDASQTCNSTSIAVWDMLNNTGFSRSISNINTVFTAEAIALWQAVTYVESNKKLVIFIDDRSVVSSLASVNKNSLTVIIILHNKLIEALNQHEEIHIVWVPGHKGIHPNVAADKLARNHPNDTNIFDWISPEDVAHKLKLNLLVYEEYLWPKDYFPRNSNIYKLKDHQLSLDHRSKILLDLRAEAVISYALYRLHITSSPVCPVCQIIEYTEHFLLEYQILGVQQEMLFYHLGISYDKGFCISGKSLPEGFMPATLYRISCSPIIPSFPAVYDLFAVIPISDNIKPSNSEESVEIPLSPGKSMVFLNSSLYSKSPCAVPAIISSSAVFLCSVSCILYKDKYAKFCCGQL